MVIMSLKKTIASVLSIILIISLSLGFFLLPKKARAAVSPQIINKQTVTLAAGENQIHSFIYHNNKIYAGTRTTPAKFLRFNDLDDLTDYDVVTFANDGLHNRAESMRYDATKDKIYIAFNYGGPGNKVLVTEIDPDDLTYTDVIADTTALAGTSPAITSDGTSLYVLTYTYPAKIIKYNLTTYAQTTIATINDGVANKNVGHALIYDGTNLYGTGAVSPGWVAKIDPSDLTHTVANFSSGNNIATDDLTIAGDYLYVGLEATTGMIVKVKKSDLSLENISTGQTVACYGTYFDGEYIWGVYNSSPGNLVRIDPTTSEINTYTFDSGENSLNEITSNGSRFFVTTWTSPAKVISFNIDTTAPVTTVSLNPPVPDGENDFYRSSPTITLSATDAGAGVDKTYYKWDNNSFQEYFSSFFAQGGIHTLYYYSADNIGNTETVKFLTIKVNTSTPTDIALTSPIVSISNEASVDISSNESESDSMEILTSVTQTSQPYVIPEDLFSPKNQINEKIAFSITVLDNLLENKQLILKENETAQFYTQTPLFSGKTVPGAKIDIEINSEHAIYGTAEVDKEGYWHYQVQDPLEYGDHTIKLAVSDSAENLSEELVYSFKIVPRVDLNGEEKTNDQANFQLWRLIILVPLGLIIIYFIYRKFKSN